MKSIIAASAAFALSASMALANIGDTIERHQLDRAMGSADTLMLDDGSSVDRTGCASLRDCFDKIFENAPTEPNALNTNNTVIGDAYRHGRTVGSYECGYFVDTESVECREIRRPFY